MADQVVNKIQQTRQQLADKLASEQGKAKELLADVKAIVSLVKTFKETVGIPDEVTIMWAIKNRKAIVELLKNIVKILRTKGHAI